MTHTFRQSVLDPQPGYAFEGICQREDFEEMKNRLKTWITLDRSLTRSQHAIFRFLLEQFDFVTRWCAPDYSQIAAAMGCDVKTVERAVAGLRDAGWIETYRPSRNACYHYRFLFPKPKAGYLHEKAADIGVIKAEIRNRRENKKGDMRKAKSTGLSGIGDAGVVLSCAQDISRRDATFRKASEKRLNSDDQDDEAPLPIPASEEEASAVLAVAAALPPIMYRQLERRLFAGELTPSLLGKFAHFAG